MPSLNPEHTPSLSRVRELFTTDANGHLIHKDTRALAGKLGRVGFDGRQYTLSGILTLYARGVYVTGHKELTPEQRWEGLVNLAAYWSEQVKTLQAELEAANSQLSIVRRKMDNTITGAQS